MEKTVNLNFVVVNNKMYSIWKTSYVHDSYFFVFLGAYEWIGF